MSLLDVIRGVGTVLDTPGAALRSAMVGDFGKIGDVVFDPSQRLTGRDVLERWGMSENQPGLDIGDIAGFGVDLGTGLLGDLGVFKGATMLGRMAGRHASNAARSTTLGMGAPLTPEAMAANAHKTAMARKSISQPVKYLEKQGLITPGERGLDFGAGRGFDANYLGYRKYDPGFEAYNVLPEGETYDRIINNFVLNTIPQESARVDALNQIQKLLSPQGRAYVSVRDDLNSLVGQTGKGTFQGSINIPGANELVRKKGAFRTFEITPEMILDSAPAEIMSGGKMTPYLASLLGLSAAPLMGREV